VIAILRAAAAATCVAALTSACSDPERDRLKQTTQASYDSKTGRLKELTFDANKNNRIDTWTEMDGARPVRSRIDRNEDGRIDRWEYYDEKGQLLKVGFSRPDDGTPDAWAYQGPSGRVERVESSSARDEKRIDRWERYAPPVSASDERGPLLSAEDDSNQDGKPDKWETYEAGALKTVAFDENADGKPDRRLTYEDGTVVLIETEPDSAGRYTRRVPVPR
jgi:hypothetical protein